VAGGELREFRFGSRPGAGGFSLGPLLGLNNFLGLARLLRFLSRHQWFRRGFWHRNGWRNVCCKPRLDALPDFGGRLDRLDHEVQFAQPALPGAYQLSELRILIEQIVDARDLIGVERAEHIFTSQKVAIVLDHELRH